MDFTCYLSLAYKRTVNLREKNMHIVYLYIYIYIHLEPLNVLYFGAKKPSKRRPKHGVYNEPL